jgi:hypothetical protein
MVAAGTADEGERSYAGIDVRDLERLSQSLSHDFSRCFNALPILIATRLLIGSG